MWKNVFNETKVENQNSHHHKNTIPKVKHGGGIIILYLVVNGALVKMEGRMIISRYQSTFQTLQASKLCTVDNQVCYIETMK